MRQRYFAVWKSSFRTIKIYTRTGDNGTSQLFSGERRAKTDGVFRTLGAIDEANSMIGLAKQFVESHDNNSLQNLENDMDAIMSRLFDIGSCVATPIETSSASKLQRTSFNEQEVTMLEELIDKMNEELPALKNFILPSGGKCAAHLHCARSITRRAEREAVVLLEQGQIEPVVTKYLNRLSDYLFTAARYVALHQCYVETVYQKPKS